MPNLGEFPGVVHISRSIRVCGAKEDHRDTRAVRAAGSLGLSRSSSNIERDRCTMCNAVASSSASRVRK